MAAACISVLRVSPICLLPPGGSLRSASGSIQECFKALPLCWDSELVKFCMCPLRVDSVSYSPLVLLNVSLAGFLSQTFWLLIFLMQDPWPGESDVGFKAFAPWGGPPWLYNNIPPLVRRSPTWRYGSWLVHISTPLPISLWLLLYIFCCGNFFSASLQIILIDSCSVSSCNFGVPVGRGKFGSSYSAVLITY